MRSLAGLTAVSMAIASGGAQALGLGSIQLNSSLNQPLSADIEVVTDSVDEAEGLVAKLASQEAFIKAGIDRPYRLTELDFELRDIDGRTVIHVSSPEPISEPFLNFLVEVGWARGSLVREYTVLLDPPVFLAELNGEAAVAESQSGVADDPSLPQRIERSDNEILSEDELKAELEAVNAVIELDETADTTGAQIVELDEVDDLLIVAPDPVEPVSESVPVAVAPVESTSTSGSQYNETVLEDIDTVVAELDRLFDESGASASQATALVTPAVQPDSGTTTSSSTATNTSSGAAQDVGPVRDGQTLWSLAKANQVSGSTIEQTMIAMLRANPQAFDGDNVNALRSGSILRMPAAGDVARVDEATARQLVNAQHTAWKALSGDDAETTVTARLDSEGSDDTTAVAPVETEATVAEETDSTDASAADGSDQAAADTGTDTASEETASDAGTTETAEVTDAAESGDGSLNIVAAETTDGVSGGGESTAETDERIAGLEQQLSVAVENAESERQNAEELQSRVLELENAFEKMNRLLEISNAELERLQNIDKAKVAVEEAANAQIESLKAELDAANEKLQSLVADGDLRQTEATARIDALQTELSAAKAAAEAEVARLTGEAEAAKAVADAEAQTAREASEAAAVAAEARAAAEAVAAAEAEAAAAAKELAEASAASEAEARARAEAAAAAEAAAEAEAEAQRLAAEQAEAARLAAEAEAAKPWYTPLLNPQYAAWIGAGFAGLLFLWFLLARRGRDKDIEADAPDETVLAATVAEDVADDFDDQTRYDNDQLDDELSSDATTDSTVAASAVGAAGIAAAVAASSDDDKTVITEEPVDESPSSPHADVLAEADVYLSYGLADRAEELLDDAIDKGADDEVLHSKRLEALFSKQDAGTFAERAETYKDKFGDSTDNWSQIAGWGAALAPASALFAGAAPAVSDTAEEVLEATEVVEFVDEGGLGSQIGEDLSDDSLSLGDGLSSELGNLEESVSADFEPLSDATSDGIADIAAGGELDGTAVISGFEQDVDPLDSTAELTLATDQFGGLSDLGDVSGANADIQDEAVLEDLELPDLADLDATGDIADSTIVDGNATGEFEQMLDSPGTDVSELGDQTLDMERLEAELLETDMSADVGGLSDELDFDAAGLSIVEEDESADMTATGDEVDTMLDLARAYIDMGDLDSAGSTLKEVVASGNANQVEAARVLQKQLG